MSFILRYHVVCDACDARCDVGRNSRRQAMESAARRGWIRFRGDGARIVQLCPECVSARMAAADRRRREVAA